MDGMVAASMAAPVSPVNEIGGLSQKIPAHLHIFTVIPSGQKHAFCGLEPTVSTIRKPPNYTGHASSGFCQLTSFGSEEKPGTSLPCQPLISLYRLVL